MAARHLLLPLVLLLVLSLPGALLAQGILGLFNTSSVSPTSIVLKIASPVSGAFYLVSAIPKSSSPSSFPLTAIVPGNEDQFTMSPLVPATEYQYVATPFTSSFGSPSQAPYTTLAATAPPAILSAYAQNLMPLDQYKVTFLFTSAADTTVIPTVSFGGNWTCQQWDSATVLVCTVKSESASSLPAIGQGGATLFGVAAAGSSFSGSVTSPPLTGYWVGNRRITFSQYATPDDSTVLANAVPALPGVALSLSFIVFTGGTGSSNASARIVVSVPASSGSLATGSYATCSKSSCTLTATSDTQMNALLASLSFTPTVTGYVVLTLNTTQPGSPIELDYVVISVDGPPSITQLGKGNYTLQYNTLQQFNLMPFNVSSPAPESSQESSTALLTVTVSKGGLLHFTSKPPATTACIPSCLLVPSQASATYMLYDTIPNLNMALSALAVQHVFPDTAGPLFLSLTLDDQAVGGYYVTNHVVNLYVPLAITCIPQQYVQTLNATLSSTLNSIDVTLSSAVDPEFTKSPSMSCDGFLAPASLALFSHAYCHFTSPRVLSIVFGYDSTWQPSDALQFNNLAFGVCQAYSQAEGGPKYPAVSVTKPSSAITAPAMTIVGTAQTVLCVECNNDFLYLTAVMQSNLALPPAYQWTVNSVPIGAPSLQLSNTSAKTLVLPLSALQKKGDYVLSLTVKGLGATSFTAAATHVVTVSADTPMILLPFNADNTTMLPSQPLSLGVTVNFTTNLTQTQNAKTTPVTFQWSTVPSLNSNWSGVNSPNLYVPPYSLTAGSYTFTVKASQSVPGQTSTTASQTFMVNVISGDLYAVINGGDRRFIASNEPLLLDGSLSFDAESPSSTSAGYTWTWACIASSGFPCLDRTTGAAVVGPTANSWLLPTNTLYPGVYNFSMTFTDGSSRSSTTQCQVFVTGYAPEAIISTVPLSSVLTAASLNREPAADLQNVQRPAGGRIINSGEQLVLFGYTNSTSPVSYSWTASGGPYPLDPSGLMGSATDTFVINALNDENYFVPGWNYTFALTVSSSSSYASGQASVTFYINQPPICASFSMTPSTGYAFSSSSSPFFFSFSPFDPDEHRAMALMTYQIYRIDLSSLLDVDLTGEVGVTSGNVGAMTTGDPNNGFQLTVGVRAWDRFRAASLTSMLIVSQPAASGVTLQSVQAYYVAVDSVSRDDTLTLMIATSNVMSALASDYVDAIAAASSRPILNFVEFYNAYSPLKKYMVQRVLDKNTNVRASVFVDFLAVVMADYSTLDQQTVMNVLSYLADLMTLSNELWNDIAQDPHVLQSVVYVIQQAFHATSMAYVGGLTETSVTAQAPIGTLPYNFSSSFTVNDSSANTMFATSNNVLALLLSHLSSLILLPGDVLGLNYNRSLSGVVGKAQLSTQPITSLNFTADPYWLSALTIDSSSFPSVLGDAGSIVTMTMLQHDGWGDKLSFDIFPVYYINITSAPTDFPISYPEGAVNYSVTYDQRACDDGWVNAGKFRLYVPPTGPLNCYLSCAAYNPETATFTNTSSMTQTLTWDYETNVITCAVSGPGLYTILKSDLAIPAQNSSSSQGIVNAITTLIDVPPSLMTNLSYQVQQDVSYLLDVPPERISNVVTSGNTSAMRVTFDLLGATQYSTQSSYSLMATFASLGFLSTSHTFAYRWAEMSSIACLDPSSGEYVGHSGCEPSASSAGVTRIEIIAIAVVAGFFGTLCGGAVLFLCCRQIKYWWDRHEFREASLDDDTEMVGAAFTGALSAREMAELNKRRRNNRVSWYGRDVESAASYTYDHSKASQSGSGKRAAFRVRSDSRGSEDGLELDDVHVLGEAGEVSAEDLAEIGLVLDGEDAEDSFVMDGKKVKPVKQLEEVDGEMLAIDDSAMSRSRGSSLGSRELSRSELTEEPSVNSRNSVSDVDGPLALSDPIEESVSRSERTPRSRPRTPSAKKAFQYSKP